MEVPASTTEQLTPPPLPPPNTSTTTWPWFEIDSPGGKALQKIVGNLIGGFPDAPQPSTVRLNLKTEGADGGETRDVGEINVDLSQLQSGAQVYNALFPVMYM